jgi:hypothetical protein
MTPVKLEFGVVTMSAPRISFGDKVRIRSAAVTDALGVAGKTGIVHGQTAPSVTGVDVIGGVTDDYAIAVMIEGDQSLSGLPRAFWSW